ncbi:MAG: hypothetical protein QW666_02705 [Candidatus Woesearchaeota archaeon]
MEHKEVVLLALIALIAIIGLILMIRFSQTGLGMYGGSLYPGKAVEKIAKERFYAGGNPEGVVVGAGYRRGYQEYMGMDPCPENYTQIGKSQYLSKPYYYGECIPSQFPEHYTGIVCCLPKFMHR